MDRTDVARRAMTTAEGQRLLDVLDEAECRRLLATASVGRVAFTEGAIPTIQPTSFAVSGNDVLIPTGRGSKMAAGSRGAVLAFEVDDYDLTERTGWNVTVIGPSRLISDPSYVTALNALGVLPWAPATTHCYIALRMAVVRGRRISSPGRPSPGAPTAESRRTMTPAERNGALCAGIVGAALGYSFRRRRRVVGSVLAAVIFAVAAAAFGCYLAWSQRRRG